MKNFIGRISALIPILVINIWLLKLTLKYDGVYYFLFSLFVAVIASIIAWTLGGQFDKAKYYYNELSNSKKELQKEKENYQQIFDSIDASIWSNDLENQKIYVSKGIEDMTGYTVQQFYEDYYLWVNIIHPEDRNRATHFYEEVLLGTPSNFEARFITAEGESKWIYMSGSPIIDKDSKEVKKINGVVLDISKRKETEELLQKSESRYRNVVELSPTVILIYQNNEIVYANPATVNILGLTSASELLGRSILDFVHPSFKELVLKRNKEIYESKIVHDYQEYKIVRPDGKFIYLDTIGMELEHDGEPSIMVVGIDVTAKKEYHEKISFMAYHDALTGLPNRHMYNGHLETAIDNCQRRHKSLAVILIDIDHFKFVNDTMGHGAGDHLLKQISTRLLENVRKGDLVSRQGGDEFSILLEDVEEVGVRDISDRIIEAFGKPFTIHDKELFTTPSIGISLFPHDGLDKETLNSKADIAMYLAKKNGKNNYQFFYEHGEYLNRKLKLEQDLKPAIAQSQFYLEYQPCLELATSKVYCVEALVRWNHPKLGFISPVEFITLAEENGNIINLGKWILKQACQQMKIWMDKGIDLKVAVNVSSLQFDESKFVELVKEVLSENGLPPQYLELEITESVMQNIQKTTATVQALKELGVKISIDDFGTGYSSLSVLSNLSIDHVKIDRSFIKEISSNPNVASLVKTMIEMGEHLKFDLIAEGIEEKEQADFLIKNGCRYGQGFYYSKPKLPAEVEHLLLSNKQ